ncbi:MAG: DUF4364 family protein [Lachnospiraceae bacterium]|nr:DUF4364 family protein [Lachnospiraceae bacterium]
MQTDSYMLYKLIILYMLNKVDFPMTNSQLSDFILGNEYTNYFIFQQVLSELIDAEFITSETLQNSSRYKITKDGRETVSFFENKISEAIKEDISNYLSEHEFAIRNKNSIIANYYKSGGEEFVVTLSINEDTSTVIDLNLSVPTEELAEKMCTNWQTRSQDIYSYVFKTLL